MTIIGKQIIGVR